MSTTTVMTLDDIRKLPPLTEEEKRIIRDAEPTPDEECPAMTAEELKGFRSWYAGHKKSVTLNLDERVLSYFKDLAAETGTAYQVLINLYLLQCAEEKKRPVFA